MRHSNLLALLVAATGLAEASLAVQPATVSAPKRKPTKAEKKAAKRARTRTLPEVKGGSDHG